MMPPDVETTVRSDETLHPRILIYWIGFSVLLSLVPLLFLLSAVFTSIPVPIWSAPLLTVILAIGGTGYSLLKYRAWSYVIQEDGIEIRRGVIIKVDTFVPFVRIQHVDTRRGPIERVLGLSSVVIFTAGSRGADVRIPGLLKKRASRLQHQLRNIIEEDESALEDAV